MMPKLLELVVRGTRHLSQGGFCSGPLSGESGRVPDSGKGEMDLLMRMKDFCWTKKTFDLIHNRWIMIYF